MSVDLTPQALNAIRRNISSSLTDTFQMMFQMDIFLLPDVKDTGPDQTVRAHMELTHKSAKACITIAITRLVVEQIGESLAQGETGRSPEVIQDIVCEITNIVGNHLRSYLADKFDEEFVISLPRGGVPNASEPPHIFDLHFRIRDNESVDLGFAYAAPAIGAV